ncbi:MAG: glycosyltransferase family 4 protein [Myxococcales bacterium]|nr:glycosyltransferase family 4 protein [Myxococcales bacterium]
MRIAYVVHQDPRGRFGGAEIYARHLAVAAARQGHETLVLTSAAPGSGTRDESSDGVGYHLMDTAPPRPRCFSFRASFDDPRAFALATQRLQDFRPEHLHVHHFLLGSARLAIWAATRRIPATATVHDYWAFCHRITWQLPGGADCPGPLGGWRCRGCGHPAYNRWPGLLLQPAHILGFLYRNSLLRQAYTAMSGVFCPSRAVLEAHRVNGFAHAKLIHRPYGLPAAEKLPPFKPGTPLRVGYLGRLAPEKGIELLLDAARQRASIHLSIFGAGDPDYTAALRDRADLARVDFAGSFAHETLRDVWRRIDVLAVPSVWRENQPLVALEAAQAGIPVLAADRGGLAELPELCGAVLVRPNSAAAWAEALAGLAERPAEWHRLRDGLRFERRIEDDVTAHLNAGATP